MPKADLNADGLIEVGERLNEAEQKITAEAIVNTVTQSETYTGTIEKLSGGYRNLDRAGAIRGTEN